MPSDDVGALRAFDMPDHNATFEARGGWMIKALAAQFGLTLEQAGGIVGNLGFESGGLKKLHEIGQPEGVGGYGWGQWTASRRVTFLAFAKTKGLDWQSDQANYDYLVEELSGPYKATIVAVRRTVTLDAAVWSVGQTYERPGGTAATNLPGYADRCAWGRRALAGAQASAASPAASAPPTYDAVRSPPAMPPVPDAVTDADVVAGVKALQQQLIALRRYRGAVDGILGPQTAAAAIAAYNAVRG